MPEGPEILYFSAYLKKHLLGLKFTEIISYTNKPIITPDNFEGTILETGCHGKLLWLKIKGNEKNFYMDIHYGITGWLTFDKPEKYIKFEFKLEDPKTKKTITMYLKDKRRFGKIKINNEIEHNKIINKLGIDIFTETFSLMNFSNIIKSKKGLLVGVLMNQSIFSGIGNYIKNEVLFLTNLPIKIKINDLTDDNIKDIYNKILFVAYSNLIEMVKYDNVEKYLDNNKIINKPKKIEIPYKFKIYGRTKTDDGQKIYKHKVLGRDSYCIEKLC